MLTYELPGLVFNNCTEQHGILPGMQASHHEGGAFRLTDNDDLCLFILVLLDGRTLLLDVGVPHGREAGCTPAFDGFQSLRNKLLRCQIEDVLHARHCLEFKSLHAGCSALYRA